MDSLLLAPEPEPSVEENAVTPVVSPTIVVVPADLLSLAVVRAALGEALHREGWDQDAAGRVVLGAGEAAANAIEHGSEPGAVVEVDFTVDRDQVRFRVVDGGRPGAPRPPRKPLPPAPASPRGRGMVIMHALADRVDVVESGRGTEVRLEFGRFPAGS